MPEILDPGGPAPPRPAGASPGDEVLVGRRAFATAQAAFGGSAIGSATSLQVGWHDTSVSEEVGSFAVVRYSAGLDDLIGEVLRVSYEDRQVFAYVLQGADVPSEVQLSLTRRAFCAISRLSAGVITADVVAVQ